MAGPAGPPGPLPNGRRKPPSLPPRKPLSGPPKARLKGGRSGLSRRCIPLKDALPLEKCPGRVRGLCALRKPADDLLFVDFHRGRLGQRVVIPDLLDEPAVSWRACVRHHQAVERTPLGAHPPQPDLHQSTSTSCALTAEQTVQSAIDTAPPAATAGARKAELPDQLLHLFAGLEQPVDVGHLRPTSCRDPPSPRPIDRVATGPLLPSHGQYDGLHLPHLGLGILVGQLAPELTAPRHHLDRARNRAQAAELPDLDEKVVECEMACTQIALYLRRFLAIHSPLGLLD